MSLQDTSKALGTQRSRKAYGSTLCKTSYVKGSSSSMQWNHQLWQERCLATFTAFVSQSLASQEINLSELCRLRRSQCVQSRAAGVRLQGLLLPPLEALGIGPNPKRSFWHRPISQVIVEHCLRRKGLPHRLLEYHQSYLELWPGWILSPDFLSMRLLKRMEY
jgi:hypothetical protein